MKKNSKNLRKKIILILCLILVVLYGIQATKTLSKYVYNNIRASYLKSKNFYFNSDKLRESTANYSVQNWSGVENYVININMNSMDNNSLRCNSNIQYNISYTCSADISCSLSKTTSTIPSNTNIDSFVVTIVPQRVFTTGETVFVEITADATYPYEKSLSGRFEITIGNLGMSYNIEDSANKEYLEFNVTNTLNFYTIDDAFSTYSIGDRIDMYEYLNLTQTNKNKCHSMLVTLTFNPNVVIIDMATESYLNAKIVVSDETDDGYHYINSITFKLDAISSKAIKFYKINKSQNYTYPFVNENSIITITVT